MLQCNKGRTDVKSGLDYFLDQVRTLTKTKPPFSGAFTAQALYLLNQSVTVIEGLHEIIRKNKLEIERLKMEIAGKKPLKSETDHIRNAEIIADYKSGISTRNIGKKHGITGARVYQILKRLGVVDGKARAERLSIAGDPECERSFEDGQEAHHSPNANGFG
jgi:hypothetical protein